MASDTFDDVAIESWEDTQVDPTVAEWFSSYENVLLQFARENGLTIGKYLKDTHSWHFAFSHPQGGSSRIDAHKHGLSQFRVTAHWRQLRYESGEYWMAKYSIKEPIEPEDILSSLTRTLSTVLAWTKDDLELVSEGNEKYWHEHMSKSEFDASENRYPLPRVKE